MPLFYRGLLQVMQLEPETPAVISTDNTTPTPTATASTSPTTSTVEAVIATSTSPTPTATASASSTVTFTQFCDNFQRNNENDVAAATQGARNDDAPAGTVCTQCALCAYEITSGQFWHLHCTNCRKPVHAQPWCCGNDSTGAPICLRCKVMLSCTAPLIPAELRPGSIPHGKHKNCTTKNLRAQLLHRNPSMKISTLRLHELYEKLFAVPMHASLIKDVRRFTRRHRSLGVQSEEHRQERWDEFVKTYPNPLYRITMPGSTPNTVEVKRSAWTRQAKQDKQPLILVSIMHV